MVWDVDDEGGYLCGGGRECMRNLFQMPLMGDGSTKFQVLKVLLNLSEKPGVTEGQPGAPVDSSFLHVGFVAKEILLQVLSLFQNIHYCLKREGHVASCSACFQLRFTAFPLIWRRTCPENGSLS